MEGGRMPRRYLIGITGSKGKGKTSFASVLTYLLSINGYAATVLHFADYIKKVARECFGRHIGKIHGKLNKKDRELLCAIGDKLREIDPNCLVKVVERRVNTTQGFIIVADVRLKREEEMIHRLGGIVVRIESDLYKRGEDYLKDHLTETEIDHVKADFQIMNIGTFADLVTEGKKVVSYYVKRRWKS